MLRPRCLIALAVIVFLSLFGEGQELARLPRRKIRTKSELKKHRTIYPLHYQVYEKTDIGEVDWDRIEEDVDKEADYISAHKEYDELLQDVQITRNDILQQKDEIMTPTYLHLAVLTNKPKFVEKLIEMGASLEVETDLFGRQQIVNLMPYQLAVIFQRRECLKILLAKQKPSKRMINEHVEVFGHTTDEEDPEKGPQLITYAANDGDLEMVRMLEKYGAVPGFKAVRQAAFASAKEVLYHFMEDLRVSPNEKEDIAGLDSPLHAVVHNGSMELALLLIKYGAKINKFSSDGLQPLDLALDRINKTETGPLFVRMLQDFGAQPGVNYHNHISHKPYKTDIPVKENWQGSPSETVERYLALEGEDAQPLMYTKEEEDEDESTESPMEGSKQLPKSLKEPKREL